MPSPGGEGAELSSLCELDEADEVAKHSLKIQKFSFFKLPEHLITATLA